MIYIKISRGLDIPITGKAQKELEILPDAYYIAVLPDSFHSIKPISNQNLLFTKEIKF